MQLEFAPHLTGATTEQLIEYRQAIAVHGAPELVDFTGVCAGFAHLHDELSVVQYEMRPGFGDAMLKMAAGVARPDRIEPYVCVGAGAQYSCDLDQCLPWVGYVLEGIHATHKIEPAIAVDEVPRIRDIELEALDWEMLTMTLQLLGQQLDKLAAVACLLIQDLGTVGALGASGK